MTTKTQTRTRQNIRTDIKEIKFRVDSLYSFMIGTLGKDPEGDYRPEFVERILRASREVPTYRYTGKGSLLRLLKDV